MGTSTSRVKLQGEETVSTAAQRASRSIRQMKGEMDKTLSPLKAIKDLMTSAFAVGGAVMAIKQVIAVAKQLVDAYSECERSAIGLAQALANNTRVTAATTDNLLAYADAMVRTIGISDEAVRQQFSFLASMNLTEKQMIAVMDAAINLSATGLTTLDQAVLALGGSFEGNIGRLGRYVPALRNLTKEQLEAGAAVELVSRAFAGQAEIMAQTISGVQQRWKEMWGEQAEKMGQPIAEGVRQAQLALLPFLDTVGDVGLYTIVVFQRMGEGLVWWFKWSYGVFFGLMKNLVETVKTAAHMLWTPIEIAFSAPIHNIKVAFVAFLNFLIEQAEWALNKLGALFMKATGGAVGKGMAGLEIPGIAAPAAPAAGRDLLGELRKDLQELGDRWATYGEDTLKGLSEGLMLFRPVPNTLQKTIDAINTTGEENRAAYFEAAKILRSGPGMGELRRIEGMTGAYWNQPAAQPSAPATGMGELRRIEGMEGAYWNQPAAPETGFLEDFGRALVSVTAQLGDLAWNGINILFNAIMASEPVRAALEAFNQVLGPLIDALGGSLVPIIQLLADWLMSLVEALSPILKVAMQVIGDLLVALQPVFDALLPVIAAVGEIFAQLAPVVGLVVQLLAGPLSTVLKILAPILSVFAGLLEALMPIINILAKALDILSRPVEIVALIFGWLLQKLIAFGTMILYLVTFQWGKLKNINWGQTLGELGAQIADVLTRPLVNLETAGIPEAGAADGGAGGAGGLGSQTTIQRAPDIYIYITVQGSVYGPGGLRQVGGEMALALQGFASIGGRIHIEEALAPVAG